VPAELSATRLVNPEGNLAMETASPFILTHAKHGDEGWLGTDVMMKVIEHKKKRLFDMEPRHSRNTGRSNATPLQSEGDSGVRARLGKNFEPSEA
jgi:hypothetical protein